jgi:cytochrome c biogenesis protein ResB
MSWLKVSYILAQIQLNVVYKSAIFITIIIAQSINTCSIAGSGLSLSVKIQITTRKK